jgi:hypothetical protein
MCSVQACDVNVKKMEAKWFNNEVIQLVTLFKTYECLWKVDHNASFTHEGNFERPTGNCCQQQLPSVHAALDYICSSVETTATRQAANEVSMKVSLSYRGFSLVCLLVFEQ